MGDPKYMVAVVGAGPAGIFASRKLSEGGAKVVLFNRDIKPGGLAEYGIYPDKLKMKSGLRAQFKQILSSPEIDYYGNVSICNGGSLVLEDLLECGFQAVLVSTGAQGTKWLRLPGENLPGVYHAKNIVFYYNLLPPYSEKKYLIGKKVAVLGAGNVMMDIAHYLVRERKVDEVAVVMRRGPAEVKFTRKEMEIVARNLDLSALNAEFDRVSPIMQAVGQDPAVSKTAFLDTLTNAVEPISQTRIRFEFLASPVRILGDWMSGVQALKVEDTSLVSLDGNIKARGMGTTRQIEADTVIFAIGDTVDKDFCVPIFNDAYVSVPSPHFPVENVSYEAFNPDTNQPIEKVFLAGWARQASTGLVGVARRDGERAATAVLEYLQTQQPMLDVQNVVEKFEQRLAETQQQVVNKDMVDRLEESEKKEAVKLGLEDFKYATNDEMFEAMGL